MRRKKILPPEVHQPHWPSCPVVLSGFEEPMQQNVIRLLLPYDGTPPNKVKVFSKHAIFQQLKKKKLELEEDNT